MNATEVWKDAVQRAVERGFDAEVWQKKYDYHNHEKTLKQAELMECSYAEAFIVLMTYTRMKALAFSQEFAMFFFPKERCDEEGCSICKDQGGHYKHVTHMKNMCEYADFTAYLEIILDEEE